MEREFPNWEDPIKMIQGASFEDSIQIKDCPMPYRVTAAFIPIYNDDDQAAAHCFCVSYTKITSPGEVRPVTFAFNGKPGSSSLYLHLGVLAPKAVSFSSKGLSLPVPPFSLKENENTLLDLTDIVMIDPVGTGMSRCDNWEKAEAFWGVAQDVEAVAQQIRTWLVSHGRWASPIVILGESYGGLRGAKLLVRLQEMGIMPAGFVALSPAFSYGELNTTSLHERHLVHTLPALAVAASYHGCLNSDLSVLSQEKLWERVHQWATREYAEILWRGVNRLSGVERKNCAYQLAKFTGVSAEDVEAMNLRPLHSQWAGLLLKGQGKVVSLFDSRLTFDGRCYCSDLEPSSFRLMVCAKTAFYDYFLSRLDLPVQRDYYVANRHRMDPPWDFTSGYSKKSTGEPTRAGGYIEAVDELALAMKRYPAMSVFVGCGYFDIHCSLDTTRYCLNHLDVPENLFSSIALRGYEGGHMFYTNPEAGNAWKQDMVTFYARLAGVLRVS